MNSSRGNFKHFLPPVNGGKKLNLKLSCEAQSMWYFFSANFHLISLFYRLITINYSRPANLSQFEIVVFAKLKKTQSLR